SPLLSRTIEEHIQKVIQCPAKDKRPQKTFPNTIIRFLMRLPWPLHIHCSIIFTFVSKIEYEWTEHSCEVWGLP
uniref:hypothetical protein n=1 Tax=Porphyromonas gingivalis TaxID=837 RepID=UPI001C53512D